VDGEAMELLETYASAPRRGILDLVSRYPSSVDEIGKEVGLEPVSVRFHLRKLLRLNLVEEVKQKGALGRPRYLYRATKRRFEVAFPRRNYMQLASILLGTLAKDPDQDQASRRLRNAGTKLGSELGKTMREKEEKWDGFSLKKHLVDGVLEDYGAEPETVACSKESIQYRVNNCPFRELAVQYPQMVCEQLDDSINSSLLMELDRNIDWRKLKCAGHGDSYCEYVATFPATR
jgi:predicted ArsR family transcriptional regulator